MKKILLIVLMFLFGCDSSVESSNDAPIINATTSNMAELFPLI